MREPTSCRPSAQISWISHSSTCRSQVAKKHTGCGQLGLFRADIASRTMVLATSGIALRSFLLLIVISLSTSGHAGRRILVAHQKLYAPKSQERMVWAFKTSHTADLSTMQITAEEVTYSQDDARTQTYSIYKTFLLLLQNSAVHAESNTSVIILSILKDSSSWGNNRGFTDFLGLLVNITRQTHVRVSLGLLVSDITTFTNLR